MGLGVCYLSTKVASSALAEDNLTRTKQALGDFTGRFKLGYDNINWYERKRDHSVTNRDTMRHAVAGQVHITDDVRVCCSPNLPSPDKDLYRRTLGGGDRIPHPGRECIPYDLVDTDPALPGKFLPGMDRLPLDKLTRAPLPLSGQNFSNLGAGPLEHRHLLQSTIALGCHILLRLHPEISHHPSDLPHPPQLLPQVPQVSTNFALPVIDKNESTMAGNVEVLRNTSSSSLGFLNTSLKSELYQYEPICRRDRR